jgi:Ca-activated chloride channel family protein
MKNMFSLLLIVFQCFTISFSSNAQDNPGALNYRLQVYQKNGRPFSGCPITLVETKTFDRKTFQTNTAGLLTLELSEGNEWIVNVGEMRDYMKLTVPQYGGTANGSATATHDPEWWERNNEKPGDRTGVTFDDIPQRWAANEPPSKTTELLEVKVQTEYGKPYKGMKIVMIDIAGALTYSAETDQTGIARFKLPLNTKYQMDLDGEEDFDWYDTGNRPLKKRTTITYETMEFKEEVNEDGYIEQTFLEEPRAISSRVFVALNVRGGPNDGANEDVYLDMAFSNKKYHAKTNENGRAYFMLPKKREYTVSFDYQKGAGSVDLKRFYGISEASMGVFYEPDERLQYPERFLPSTKDLKLYDINNFRKQPYEDIEDDNLINVHARWGNNKIGSGAREALLEIGFSVKEPLNKKAIEKPLNVAFVLDKSGSMSGENIEILKSAMEDFIAKLRPIDNVSLVFFDTEAVVAYECQKANKAHLLDLIAALKADGGTSIYEGLKLGYAEVSKNASTASVNRLILLTDGYGSKPVDDVLDLSDQYFKKGISVSTIGVGEGYNSALLSLLSKYSGGLEHQAINADGISEALDKEFESLLYPLASNLSVKVKYNNRVIYKSLYGIPEAKNRDGVVQFDLEKVFSSMDRMVLMKFKLDNPDQSIEKDKISIDVSYFDEVKGKEVDIHKEMGLEWSDESDVEMIHDKELAETYSVAVINQMLKTIADQCDNKNFVEARKSVKETLRSVKKLNKDKFSPELLPIIETLNTYLAGLEQAIVNQK